MTICLLFEDSLLKLLWELHYYVPKECHSEIILRLNGNRNTSVKSPLRFFVKIHQVISFFVMWGIRHYIAIIMILQWTLQIMITWESQDFFIITSPGDSLESSSHSDFSVEWLNESKNWKNEGCHISLHCNDCELVTIYDVRETVYRQGGLEMCVYTLQ